MLVRVLSVIERLNQAVKRPGMNDLLSYLRIDRPHTDYLLSILLDRGYIDKLSTSEPYYSTKYSITAQGSNFLRQHKTDAKEFAALARQLCVDNKREQLYDHISRNRNLFWFAYYDGFLTKKDLRNFKDLLQMEMNRFFWKSELWADFYNRGYGVN